MKTTQQDRLNQLADLGEAVVPPPRRGGGKAAPVQMMEFAADPNADKQERLEGVPRRATTVRQLDPHLVRRSAFANRHPDEFATEDYREFSADVKAAGGNSIPGKVRRLHGAEEGRYELIFGHRRHQACMDAGVPFLAEICEADDRTLYEEMTRENLFRKDPTPWDWGQHYAAGLASIYTSQEELCRANRKSKAHVSTALQLATLPREVVDAFPSPTTLQLAWGPALADAVRADRDGVLRRAADLKGAGKGAAEVFRTLVGVREKRSKRMELKVHGREVGSLSYSGGALQLRLTRRTLAAEHVHEFRKLIQEFLAQRTPK